MGASAPYFIYIIVIDLLCGMNEWPFGLKSMTVR